MTSIEWTRGDDGTPGKTWNPVVGCSRVSAGCERCYAERVAHRAMQPAHEGLTVLGKHGPRWTGEVRFLPERLEQPLRWKKPRRVFVNSMSDLFHEKLSFEQIATVFGVMAACPQHTFQVLTKRPERAVEFFEWLVGEGSRGWVWQTLWSCLRDRGRVDPEKVRPLMRGPWPWPLPNVWLGCSVEDQATADARIPHLLRCPAAVRWVSYEPALAGVDFGMQSATCDCCPRWSSRWVHLSRAVRADKLPDGRRMSDATAVPGVHRAESNRHGALSVRTEHGLLGIKPAEFEALPGLDWLVIGGESGPGARPFDVAWARSAIAQCRAASVPCFVKQLGAKPYDNLAAFRSWGLGLRPRDRKGGDPSEWPEDLRVREYPEARRG